MDLFERIHAHVNRSSRLSDADLEIMDGLLEKRMIKRKTMLLQEGEVCHFEAFVNQGCIRSYYLDENGFEVTLQFAIEDWWVSDIASFHEQKPSHMFIEALEDCELLVLNPATKESLLQQLPSLERYFRLMVQRNLSSLQSRLFKTIATSAQDKYLDFLEKYPTIPQRVPQHYIASYLGISPEFLSKIRTRMARKSI
ncbi:Crp/Fnr family transcriptional regulator [Terrimonas ferruginea]|uniref:Crp/Fnr family transcriptional regulator n=1 Tax=Terrimonas ferruginea TaxID=249 RepID=UPI000416002E|nr:Crp/Fnr family transcriptional regulator [Terrimonas ferruginea]